MRTMDYDECTIAAYDSQLGEITCEDDFDGYHFGDTDSTEDDYEVDMRAEIWLMDRNIKITASQDDIGNVLQEPWGCQVLVSDFREATLVQRIGNLYMDNVQVYNCSQKMTYKGAIRWENASKGYTRVQNSVISSGRAVGLVIENSANVEIVDTTVADFIQQGIWIFSSTNVTVDGAWVHHIIPEVDIIPAIDEYPILLKYEIGGITASQGTSEITIRNCIVSGAWHNGYHFTPEECDEDSH